MPQQTECLTMPLTAGVGLVADNEIHVCYISLGAYMKWPMSLTAGVGLVVDSEILHQTGCLCEMA